MTLRLLHLLAPIEDEMIRSENLFGAFNSTHEAYGVIAEEFAELLDAIRSNDMKQVAHEAIQIAACAARLAAQAQHEWSPDGTLAMKD